MTKKIKFMETVLRDGQQSQIATRMPTSDMLPILETLDQAGFDRLEVWGGATFDTCLRFLNEDPWERLRQIRAHVKNTKLQMLLRGQNILGYKNYPDDVVRGFVEYSIKNGIDVIRIFDALNDVRNLRTSIEATKEFGGEAQACLSYTTSDVHTVDYFVNLAKELVQMGTDTLAIKDMAGVLTPGVAYELVSRLKDALDIPIEVHTHSTAGVAEMTLLKSAEAGADIIDTCISSFSSGTSQPTTEAIALALEDLGFETDLDFEKLTEVANHFNTVRDRFREDGTLNPKVKDIEPKALIFQVPGGMLSNLLSQLKIQHAEDKFDLLLEEVPAVRADVGFPPLVTPMSQIVGTQALLNVLTGERYKIVSTEMKDYVAGHYGKSPVEISPEIRQKIIKDTPVMTGRPADFLEDGLPEARAELAGHAKSEEEVLSYIAFPAQAKEYYGWTDL